MSRDGHISRGISLVVFVWIPFTQGMARNISMMQGFHLPQTPRELRGTSCSEETSKSAMWANFQCAK